MTIHRLDYCSMDLDPLVWQRIERRATEQLNTSWHEVLKLLDEQGQLTVSEVTTTFGIGRGSARTMLEVLHQIRVVRIEQGPGHTNRYLLNREDLWVLFS